MYASEIKDLVSHFPVLSRVFLGVFARDEIQSIRFVSHSCAIVNLDPLAKSGSHWTAIFCYDLRSLEYFDSLGAQSSMLRDISLICDELVWNSTAVQGRSRAC